jgi:D-alanyl-D-alanine dipeptidase
MNFRIIPKLIASFLMLVVGSQTAKASSVVSDVAGRDRDAVISTSKTTPSAMLDFGMEGDRSSDSQPAPSSVSNERSPVSSLPKVKPQTDKPKQGQGMSASTLFASKKSPGSIAVAAAEGNMTYSGKVRSIYFGHTDPGNHVTNKGFCSWNKAKNISVAQADERCLAALQRQSAATHRKMTAMGIDSKRYPEALVNGTDLWNQSNSAGPKFASKYKKALDKGMKNKEALLFARVEAFRDRGGSLDASGLFGICNREAYYRAELTGLTPYSESWRWNCIALDQRRRVREVGKALKQNMGETIASPILVASAPTKVAQKVQRDSQPKPATVLPNSPALSFDPVVEPPPILVASAGKYFPVVQRSAIALVSQVSSDTPALSFEPDEPETVPAILLEQPSNEGKVEPPPKLQPLTPASDNNEATVSDIDSWTPNMKKAAYKGDYVASYTVTSPYGMRMHPVTGGYRFHGGVDLATPSGTNIYAIGKPGTQTNLWCWTDSKGGGLVATMTSPSLPSLKFDALHLSWCKADTNGPKIKVDAGKVVGGTGNTGRSTGPHLHFQVKDLKSGKRISPKKGQVSWVLTGKEPKKLSQK